MKRTLRLFRLLVVTAVSLLVAAPVALYILLSAPWAQSRLCAAAERELSALLGSRVDVGRVTIHPFNRVDISDIHLDDDHGNPCLDIKMLGARFELYHFLRTQRIVFDYALVDRPVVRLSRASAGAPLNIDGILSRLKGNPDTPASRFKFKIATLAVRDGSLTYDVLDSPLPDSARFSPAHIALESLDLHASLRLISNDVVNIELDRLSFVERSGFTLTDLTGNLSHDSDGLRVDGLTLELPNTTLAFNAAWTRSDGQWSLGTDSVQPSVLYVPDLAAFAPVLADTYIGLDMEISAHGDSTSAMLPIMNMSTRDGALAIQLDGGVLDFGRSTERIWLNNLRLRSYAPTLVSHISKLMSSRPRVLDRLALLGKTDIEAQASINGRSDLAVNFSANTSAGRLGAKINSISADTFRTAAIKTEAKLMDLDAGSLLAQRKLGRVSARLTADGTLTRQGFTGDVTLDDANVQFNGRTCDGISADASIKGNVMDGNIKVDDRDVQLELAWNTEVKKSGSSLNIEGELVRFDFATLWP
ncbi:MAG: AsmA-like C-terminal region-containing protein, partial [Muribaculaceae bacterium]|nr:AsmA-like C-terminal region-containing protein [Muribaculaceae bacterium]